MTFWTSLNQESFMKYFSDGAQSFQCFFYFLATISLVSVLDSYDFSQSTNKNFWYALPTTSSPLIISVVLMSSVVLSLICAPLDDKLAALAMKNNWTSENNITLSWVDWDLEWWVTFNYVRCTGAVLTWILFCVGLGPDALWNQLFDLLNLSKKNEEEISGSK
ncbi:uncharacterized protein LOC124161942 isoform X2 [Ischnura elegans]|nr:uncharacterized protein LOC124161942 isoform X2 [Ischnura elegans]